MRSRFSSFFRAPQSSSANKAVSSAAVLVVLAALVVVGVGTAGVFKMHRISKDETRLAKDQKRLAKGQKRLTNDRKRLVNDQKRFANEKCLTEIEPYATKVTAFLKESATEEQVNAILKRLDSMNNGVSGSMFEKVSFLDKKAALAEARKQFEDSPEVIDGLQGNPFPMSVSARLADPTPARIDRVKAAMKALEGVDEVQDDKLGSEYTKGLC